MPQKRLVVSPKNLPLCPTTALSESEVARQSHTETHGFIAALFNALHLLTKRRGVANENLIKMSVVIRVYANHRLDINSYWASIGQIERKLKSKIKVGKRSDYDITDDKDNIVYFANHDYFSKRFEEGWGITVLWELSKVSNAVNYSDLASGKYEYSNNNWFMEGTSETKT